MEELRGTPEEIAQWHEMQGKKQIEGWLKAQGTSGKLNKHYVTVRSNYPNSGKPCYCTGACMGSCYTINICANKDFDTEKVVNQISKNIDKYKTS